MTLAILLLGLVVATCVIAYLADNLGKNLGKKRISLFGLRPRQTATLISMASSVGVMLLTVVILMLTSRSLTNALLYYDEQKRIANRERERAENLAKELEYQIESKRRTIIQSERDLQRVQKVLGGTRTQLLATRVRLTEVERQRGTAERARIAAQRSAEAARRSAAAARRSAQSAQARYAQARRAFETLRSQLQSARTQYVTARSQLAQEQGRVQQAQVRIKQVQSSLGASRLQLEAARGQLDEAQRRRDEAQKSFDTAQKQLNVTIREMGNAVAQYETAKAQLTQLETRSTQLQQELASRQDELRRLDQIGGNIATGNISVKRGTVFAESTVQPGTSVIQIRAVLQRILQEGRGALGDNKSTLELAPLPLTAGGQTVWLRGDQIIARLTEYLGTFDVPVSIRLTAARDHAVDETEIRAQYITVPVRRIFANDEQILERSINGNSSDARIFNQLLKLLNESEGLLRGRGLLPLLDATNPDFYAVGTNERVFEALRKIQALKAPARVRVVAAQDINTVEPVRVRFEVERE